MIKLIKRMSFLDVVIVAAVVFFAIGLYSRHINSSAHTSSAHECGAYISAELHALTPERASALLRDTTLSYTHGERLGVLDAESVSAVPASVWRVGADGKLYSLSSKSLYDLSFVIMAEGFFDEGGFFVGGKRHIAPNMTVNASTSCGEFELFITNIDVY